jgi:predicted acyltransferase
MNKNQKILVRSQPNSVKKFVFIRVGGLGLIIVGLAWASNFGLLRA